MRKRLGTQQINQSRRAFHYRFHRRVFGVEDAQRVAVQPTARFFVKRIEVLFEVGNQ